MYTCIHIHSLCINFVDLMVVIMPWIIAFLNGRYRRTSQKLQCAMRLAINLLINSHTIIVFSLFYLHIPLIIISSPFRSHALSLPSHLAPLFLIFIGEVVYIQIQLFSQHFSCYYADRKCWKFIIISLPIRLKHRFGCFLLYLS